MSERFPVARVGGPMDGALVHPPPGPDGAPKEWARWVDEEGRWHFYHLEFLDAGPRFVYQGERPA